MTDKLICYYDEATTTLTVIREDNDGSFCFVNKFTGKGAEQIYNLLERGKVNEV